MVEVSTLVMSIVAAVFASTGFWTFITYIIQRKDKKESSDTLMIKGLGHDRICHLGESYLKRGWLTPDEYENLHDYLYIPYEKMSGNGTAKKIMDDVKKLPLKKEGEQ